MSDLGKLDRLRTICECCEGARLETPMEHLNRPGLAAIDYRVGTHGRFKASMLSGISSREMLAALTTRRDDDWTVALLDAWAVALDVLTFYQERIANEGFVRTATERRSLLELARLVGYEPRPGVSASTHLAFRVSSSSLPSAEGGLVRPRGVVLPPTVAVPAGTRAQSSPGPDELPQPFETSEDLEARQEWNELRPRLTEPQLFDRSTRRFFLEGTATGLAQGDWVLVNAPASADPDAPGDFAPRALQIAKMTPDDARGWTEVRLIPAAGAGPGSGPGGFTFQSFLAGLLAPPFSLFAGKASGGQAALQGAAGGYKLSGSQVSSLGTVWGVAPALLGKLLAAAEPKKPKDAGLFALRVRAHVFGHNAPRWRTLPRSWRENSSGKTASTIRAFHLESGTPPYASNWDDGSPPPVDETSQGAKYRSVYGGDHPTIVLERAFDEVVPGSWLVLRGTGKSEETSVFRVAEAEEVSRADFGLSGKATRVGLEGPVGGGAGASAFTFRDTAVHTASEELALARVPVEGDVAGRTVDLDHVLEIQLEPGRLVAVTGERTDVKGAASAGEEGSDIVASEIAVIEAAENLAGFTRLTFVVELEHSYRRESVTLNANVIAATHGETRREVLGSGDAAAPFQRFALQGAPLTYLPSRAPSGGESSLEVRVQGVRWHESPDFYRLGPADRRYVLRRGDDGATSVLFGDGVHGSRLPTVADGVRAVYRIGVGLGGHVDTGRVSLLATRPLGVDEVVNPVPARGAQDPETRDRVRDNAPLTVRTLDRIVSLEDFADYARAYSGIGKAHAARVWDGERWLVHVTVAAADGGEVGDDLRSALRASMDASREPHHPLVVGSFRPRFFDVEARLHHHPDHLPETVVAAADAALRAAYDFEVRELGQRVAASDVITLLQEVTGVVAVDLERFRRQDAPAGDPPVARHLDALPAGLVSSGGETALVGTEMLLLAPGLVPLTAVRSLTAPDLDEAGEEAP